MAKKSQTLSSGELDAFERQVELALELAVTPRRLGRESPLAQPYFLGQTLTQDQNGEGDETRRGELLFALLQQCAGKVEPELQHLLTITYLHRDPAHDNVALALKLNLSDRTFYRNRILAIKALANALHRAVAPPVRPERPGVDLLLGRDELISQALGALEQGQTLYLHGPSGMGKSSAGAAVAEQWRSRHDAPVFWYTVREHFNDNAASFLFALAAHLHGLGASFTWRQLVAERTVTDLERAISLIRYDLATLTPGSLLFCIDDMDLLQGQQSEPRQVLQVVEALRGLVPLLLMGQRVVTVSDAAIALNGLDVSSTAAMLARLHAPPIPPGDLFALVKATAGHPALLRLVAALLQSGDSVAAALAAAGEVPSVEALLLRIWRRLSAEERALAMQLAVFRTAAPLDVWHAAESTVSALCDRGLATLDRSGGIGVVQFLRHAVLAQIPANERATLHLRAGQVREERGETTLALHHWIEGGQPAYAVWSWFAHREREIEHGQAASALSMLQRVPAGELADARDQTVLQLALSELLLLAGRGDEAEAALRGLSESERGEIGAWVRLHMGQAQEMTGRIEQALQSYRASVEHYLGLPQQHEVVAHLRTSFLAMYRQHDAEEARRQALLARAKADAFLGDLESLAGRYESALAHLRAAEAGIHASGGDLATQARISTYLGALHIHMGEAELALDAIEHAIQADEQRGDTVRPLYNRLNRAMALKELGQFTASEAEARDALRGAERLQQSYLVAGLAAGVAEACWGAGKVEEAERYSLYALEQEEVFFRAPACVILALVRCRQGRTGEGEQLFAAAIQHAREIGDHNTEAYAWRERGRAALERSDGELAVEAFAGARALYAALGLNHAVSQIDLLARGEESP